MAADRDGGGAPCAVFRLAEGEGAAEPHPLETEAGLRLLWLVENAGSEAEWRVAVAALVFHLCAVAEPKVKPSLAIADRWRAARWKLQSDIASGWLKPDRDGTAVKPKGAPRKLFQEISDTWLLETRLIFARAVDALCAAEGITPGEARRRIERMERLTGCRLARSPKEFKRLRRPARP